MKTSLVSLFLLITVCSIQAQNDSLEKKLSFSGDLRFRIEQDWNSQLPEGGMRDNRTRLRLRARVGFSYQAHPNLSIGARIRTGNPQNPQDPHITLGKSKQAFGLYQMSFEKIFLRYTQKGFTLNLGKFSFPFEKQNEVFWNDNVYPEGFSISYSRSFDHTLLPQSAQLTAGHFLVHSPGNSLSTESYLQAAQLAFELRPAQISLYAGMFHFEKLPIFPGDNAPCKLDYSIVNIGGEAQLSTKIPLSIGGDYYHNLSDYSKISDVSPLFRDQKQGFACFLNYGQLKKKHDILFRLTYARIEKYAIVDYFAQNDWARWDYSGLGAQGSRLSNFHGLDGKIGYVLSDNITLLLRAFFVEALVVSSTHQETGNRVRLDLDIRF